MDVPIPKTKPKKKIRPKPFLYSQFCKACGRCLTACPKTCIHMSTEIDPATGSVLGAPTPVTVPGGSGFDVTSANDLAMRAPGDFVMVDANAFYSLDLATGVAALLFLDTDPDDETPNPYFFAGLAASEDGSLLFAFDVTGEEDIVEYTAAFSRSEIDSNVLPSFNSGRGDLASAYVAPAVPSTGPLAGLALVLLASTLAIHSLSRTRRPGSTSSPSSQ